MYPKKRRQDKRLRKRLIWLILHSQGIQAGTGVQKLVEGKLQEEISHLIYWSNIQRTKNPPIFAWGFLGRQAIFHVERDKSKKSNQYRLLTCLPGIGAWISDNITFKHISWCSSSNAAQKRAEVELEKWLGRTGLQRTSCSASKID